MSINEELRELIYKMAKLLPISIEDAAAVIYSIDSGYDTLEILKKVKKMKREKK